MAQTPHDEERAALERLHARVLAYLKERRGSPAPPASPAPAVPARTPAPAEQPPRRPLGVCPACGKPVFIGDDPVWTCPCDLAEGSAWRLSSPVSEEQMERAGVYSNCPSEHGLDGGWCVTHRHMPLHAGCYDDPEARY